jgi:4a-hydroxytetrahydrobiopterin dehydratase
MQIQTSHQLASKKCQPCEGGVPAYPLATAQQQLEKLDAWQLTNDNQRIRKDWAMNDFDECLQFFNQVAEVAQSQAHHPDLHLVGYRNVWGEIWTHAIGGLSENDFILAARIDQIKTN